MQADPFKWNEILDYIRAKHIVPVIGADLIRMKTGQFLYDFIAEELAKKQNLCSPRDEELNLMEYVEKNQNSFMNIKRNIEIIYSNIPFNDYDITSLEKICKIDDFEFYISASFDTILQQVLHRIRCKKNESVKITNYSILDYASTQEIHKEYPVSVFNLFGNVMSGDDFAVKEEEILEYVYTFQNKFETITDLVKNIKGKDLLLIGCNFPNWLLRFLIRILSNERFKSKKVGKIIADENIFNDRKLSRFLNHYGVRIIPIGKDNGNQLKQEYLFSNTSDFIDELFKGWINSKPKAPVRYSGSVFLSYAHEDRDIVNKYFEALRDNGINVWYDSADLESGDAYKIRIKDEIRNCSVFIPLISEHSIQSKERFVYREEWRSAESRMDYLKDNSFIKPFIIDKTPVTDMRIPKFLRDMTIKELNNSNEFVENITSNLSKL